MPAVTIQMGLLGKAASVTNQWILMYEVPTSASGANASLTICNTNDAVVSASFAITKNAATAIGVADHVLSNMPIEPNGNAGLTCGAISPGEKVYFRGSTVGIAAQLRGYVQSAT